MWTFWEWLLNEHRPPRIEPSVLHGYDQAFRDRLRELIGRTTDARLRAKLIEMLDCPIRDSRGQYHTFAEYIYAALIKNGIADRYDMEAALSYVVGKMLMDRSEATGAPKTNLFTGFTERPHTSNFNPLQARFLSFLQGAVNNIRRGKSSGSWISKGDPKGQ